MDYLDNPGQRSPVRLSRQTTAKNYGSGAALTLQTFGARESGTQRLNDAVTAYQNALLEFTRERVPLDWAMTQNNLGNALQELGARESGTQRLNDAVTAFQNALLERTRERVPPQWASSQYGLARVLAVLAIWQKSAVRMQEAIARMRDAADEYKREGNSYWLPIAQRLVSEMEFELIELQK
jgi:tetratricopeptide (TPR) repeat protein